MALYQVVTGNVINAADLNQTINYLQQPSGGTETQTGALVIQGSYTSGWTVGQWFTSRSQGSTPVSAATSSTTLTGVGSLSTSNLGISGVNVNANSSGGSNTSRFITTLTIQY